MSRFAEADLVHAEIGAAYRRFFAEIERLDDNDAWVDEGARDCVHAISMRYGVSMWKAARWLGAARALPVLPDVEHALLTGALGVDKVLELCRFATPDDERSLVAWATRVSTRAIRERGDLAVRRSREETVEVERARYLEWWSTDEGRRLAFEGELSAADGAVVVSALDRLARRIPVMPDDDAGTSIASRRADALVAVCGAAITEDPDPDRATVVIHADTGGSHAGLTEDGSIVPPETVQRLVCTSRVQGVVQDGDAVIAVSAPTRLAPAWMLRQVRYRDRGCTFPGCGARRFTEAHHVTFWRDGGSTTLENLTLVCSWHHRLVHEHGWSIARGSGGDVTWHRPDGMRHLATGPPARAPAALQLV